MKVGVKKCSSFFGLVATMLFITLSNASAYDLELGDSLDDVTFTGTDHHYSIYLTNNQMVVVQLQASLQTGSLRFDLLDSNENVIEQSDDRYIRTGESGTLEKVIRKSGEYTLLIDGTSSTGGIYDLQIISGWANPGTQDNDRIVYSHELLNRYAVSGNYALNQKDQYFRFTASHGSEVSVRVDANLDSSGDAIDFKIYDQKWVEIAESDNAYIHNGEHGTATFTAQQPSGLFYLKVFDDWGNPVGSYDLSLTNTEPNNDSDGDGLYDAQEYFHRLSKSSGDTDSNGVGDYAEVDNGDNASVENEFTLTQVESATAQGSAIQIPSLGETISAPINTSSSISSSATWYSFELEKDESAIVVARGFLNNPSFRFKIYDAQGSEIEDSSTYYIGDDVVGYSEFTVDSSGTYYVKVSRSYSECDGYYEMTVYESWQNAGAKDCQRDYYGTYLAARCLAEDGNFFLPIEGKNHYRVYYRFETEGAVDIEFSVTPHINNQGSALKFKVFDSSGNEIDESAAYIRDGVTETMRLNLYLPGSYYLVVFPNWNYPLGNYDLSYTLYSGSLAKCSSGRCSTAANIMPIINLLLGGGGGGSGSGGGGTL